MADNTILTTTSNFTSARVNVAFRKTLLKIGEFRAWVRELADKSTIDRGKGRTARWVRHERLDLPNVPLTESIDPDGTQSVINTIEVTASQFGLFVVLSDRNQFETDVDLIKSHMELVADAVFRKAETNVHDTLLTGTNVLFAGSGNTARGDLADGDDMSTKTVYRALAILTNGDNESGGAFKMNGKFSAIIHDLQSYDLREDDSFFAHAIRQEEGRRVIEDQVAIVEWLGVRFHVTNWMHEFENTGASGSLTTSGSGTSLTNVSHTVIVTSKKNKRQFEELIYDSDTVTPGAGEQIDLTTPITTGRVYQIYVDTTSNGTPFLFQANVAPNTAVAITSIDTSAANAPAQPATGVKVFPAYFFGQAAYGVTELLGETSMPRPRLITGPSPSNPLNLRTYISAKWDEGSVVLNDNFLVRVESTSEFS